MAAEPGADRLWGRPAGVAWARLAHALAPLLIAVPTVIVIATMVARALDVSHPDLGFATTVNSDAEAFYLGETIYQDPADGFTGQLYTPLFPFLVSLLHRIDLWGGWPLLLNYASTFVLIGLAALLAFDRTSTGRGRALALVGALGMGAFAWWVVSVLPVNLLFEGRSDHTAWALALSGLVLLAWRPNGSMRVLAGAVLLLSAAFWAKQTTAVASVAAVLWVLATALLGGLTWRRALVFCAALLATNLAVLGILNLATDGWEHYFDFELAREHPQFADYGPSAREFGRYVAAAVAFPVLLGLALAVRTRAWRRLGAPGALLARSRDARLATLLAVFVLVGSPLAVYFRLKVGSEPNQYVGVLWGLGLLAALAWRGARVSAVTALIAVGLIGVLVVLAQRPGETVRGYWVAPLERTREYTEVPPELVDYARTNLVWHQVQSDLNVEPQRSLYPNFYNVVDLLAAGKQPLYLVRAFLDRRFDAVAPITFPPGPTQTYWDLYSSGAGDEEEHYIWKLNEVIRAGYAPAAGTPAGFLARSPGPSRAPWMRDCFGPFELGGRDFGIRRGGGFWCRDGTDAVVLRDTPAPVSEIHALDPVDALAGELRIRTDGPVTVSLSGGDGHSWALSLRPALGGGARLEASVDGQPAGDAVVLPDGVSDRPVVITFEDSAEGDAGVSRAGAGGALARMPGVEGGDLSIRAARGSEARVELRP